jgi:hypothetical protein
MDFRLGRQSSGAEARLPQALNVGAKAPTPLKPSGGFWPRTNFRWNGFGRACILPERSLYFKARAKSAARIEQCSSHEWSLSSKNRIACGTLVFLFFY